MKFSTLSRRVLKRRLSQWAVKGSRFISQKELEQWARKIKKWKKTCYIYFDNDASGYAVENARQLKKLCQNISS